MKTFKLFLIATILFTISASSQITKGNWMVGGDANYTNSKVVNTNDEIIGSANSIRIFPNIGYFIYDKFALGINGLFNYGKDNGSDSSIGFGAGPFARYYFLNTENRINLLAEANYSYYSSRTNGFVTDSGSSYRFKTGPVIYFNSSVAMEMSIIYLSEKTSNFTAKYFTVGLGFQIHLEK
jgi:hypothetical protein